MKTLKLTLITAVASLALTAGTANAARFVDEGADVTSRTAAAKTIGGQGGTVQPGATTTTVYVTAFPTGGAGSGTEATCGLWSGELNYAAGAMDAAVANNDLAQYQEAQAAYDQATDDALDAGCVVIH
jgi:hypothetical protein